MRKGFRRRRGGCDPQVGPKTELIDDSLIMIKSDSQRSARSPARVTARSRHDLTARKGGCNGREGMSNVKIEDVAEVCVPSPETCNGQL